MGEYYYSEIADLQSQIDTHQANISYAFTKIDSIDEKLDRLRSEKKTIVNIKKEIYQLKFYLERKNKHTDWKGQQRNDFFNRIDELCDNYKELLRELNAFFYDICDEITRLENQKNEQKGIIGWCQSQMNYLGNCIEKLLNTSLE